VIVEARAKINLGLQIVRRRDDGYHDIDTVFHRIGWSDEMEFRKTERGITLTTSLPELPCDERNLCVRAAATLFELTGYDGGIHIDLRKNVPIGAGLGGGSSDAAAVLKALPSFLDIPVASEDLFQIASRLGSDVPYFLEDGSAYAQGRGELLSYFNLALPWHVLVVYPGIHISTAWAYRRVSFPSHHPIHNLKELILANLSSPVELVNKMRNDFEPVVFPVHEETMRVKEIMYRTGADFSLMSGSGSSVFGLFRDESRARETMEFFGRKYRVHLTAPGF
jgi:4-diphosphocytidyl-2-C-methyl-D-erythritol kinase